MSQFKVDFSRDEDKNKKDHPIASREAIYACLETPKRFEDVFEALNSPSWAHDALYKRISAMVRDGQLKCENKVFSHTGPTQLVTVKARLDKAAQTHILVDGVDLVLNERQAQGVFPGDELVVRISKPVKTDSVPVVVKINHSGKNHIVCLVKLHKGKLRLLPFDQKIKQHLLLDKDQVLREGEVLAVRRANRQTSRRFLTVCVEKVLGKLTDVGIERKIAEYVFKLSSAWPEDYVHARAAQTHIAEEANNRESWLDIPLVTIDGIDAKDYDDAVFVERKGEGYRLYVAIADVSHYVEEGTDLDQEARKRGNSVYMPGHVVPMLPEVLSNQICSLMPDVERLALGCAIDFDKEGNRTAVKLAQVVIKSRARLIYEDVDQMLSGKKEVPHWWQAGLDALNGLSHVLRKKRVEKGTIVLRSHETKFLFDDNGDIASLQELERGWSHQMIEECMLAANMAVGYTMYQAGVPLIYRCHSEPDSEKVSMFRDYLSSRHIDLPKEPTPKDLQKVIDACRKLPDARAIEMMVLRTLSQAYYTDEDSAHYALGTEYYTHFTSPIRRYVDLTVHRAVVAWLNNQPQSTDLEGVAAHCSVQERTADEASWFTQAWLKTKWITPYVGKRYRAKISSVTHFGLFVTLDEQPIEGLVHISNLGYDYFTFDADTMILKGDASSQIYALGQKVNVRLKSVDLLTQRVDFSIDD